jgi:hypothetical protein|tara:strand:+ start:303 stop:569 length:267 start_codon:yes stop_codon:yes gene_type:complete
MYNEIIQELEQAQQDRLDGNITEAEYDRILTNAQEDAIAVLHTIACQYSSADDGIDAEHMRDVFNAPYPNLKYRSKFLALRTELDETV